MTERKASYRVSYARRVDGNHRDIVNGLELAGYPVLETYRAGFGVPDAFALSKAAVWVAFEFKCEGGRETKAEAAERARFWPAPWFVIHDLNEALKLMEGYDK